MAALWLVLHHDRQLDRVRDGLVMLEDGSVSQLHVLGGCQHDRGGSFAFCPPSSLDSQFRTLSAPADDDGQSSTNHLHHCREILPPFALGQLGRLRHLSQGYETMDTRPLVIWNQLTQALQVLLSVLVQ